MKKMFINGRWEESSSGETRTITNPFNQEVITTAAEGDETDAKRAIAAARAAFDHGDWSQWPAHERGKRVYHVAQLLERDKEELAQLETLDTGKTIGESLADMEDIAEVFRYFAGLADKEGGEYIS